MNRRDDYVSGPHNRRAHFAGGLVLGLALGYWWFGGMFSSAVLDWAAILVTGATFALGCAQWGERAWQQISDWLAWWFGTLR